MFLDQKIEKISNKEYRVEGPGGYETVTPSDFSLRVDHATAGTHYDLSRKKEEEIVSVCQAYLPDHELSIFDHFKSAKTLARRVLKRELGEYFPSGLVNDIVELYFLREERERHPLR